MLVRLFIAFVLIVFLSEKVVCQRLQRLTSPFIEKFSRNAVNNTDEFKEAKTKLADKISTLLDSVHSSKTFVKNPLLA